MPLIPADAEFIVLIVEDNDYVRETMQLLLEGPDRRVEACATAEEALAFAEAGAVDVVITDVSLPGMSGVELARRLQQREPVPDIVISSGYGWGAEVTALGPRVRAMPKPVDADDLSRLLDELRVARRAGPPAADD